jgi:hypothetical protein
MMNEMNYTGTNVQFLFMNNTITGSSGFVIFYNSAALAGVSSIALQGNTLILPTGVLSKGYICLDQPGVGGTINTNCRIAAYDNIPIAPSNWRVDFSDASMQVDFTVAYLTAGFTAPSPRFNLRNWVNLRKTALGPLHSFAALTSTSNLAAGSSFTASSSSFVTFNSWARVEYMGQITYPAASSNGTINYTVKVFKNGVATASTITNSIVKQQTLMNGESTFCFVFYDVSSNGQTSANYSLNITNNSNSTAALNVSNCSTSILYL